MPLGAGSCLMAATRGVFTRDLHILSPSFVNVIDGCQSQQVVEESSYHGGRGGIRSDPGQDLVIQGWSVVHLKPGTIGS